MIKTSRKAMPSNKNNFLEIISIYAIGSIGSKLINFILVPIYTFFLSREDLGIFDVALSAIFLLIPIITFDLRDAAFRFMINESNSDNRKATSSIILQILIRNSIITTLLSIPVYFIWGIEYFFYYLAMLLTTAILEVLIQVLRGDDGTKLYVAVSIVTSLAIGIVNIFLITWAGLGVKSIFIGNIAGRIIALLMIEYKKKYFLNFFSKNIKNPNLKAQIIKYTLPLIPNVLLWWVITSSNRFVINHYCGLDGNGTYSVAAKFADILQTFAMIFYQSWQEFAIREIKNPNKDQLFSNFFNTYLFFISSISIIGFISLKLLFPYIIGADFQESIGYIFPIFVSVIFYSLCTFLDLAYQATFQSKRCLPSIISTSILLIVLYLVLAPLWGIMGIIIASIIAFLFMTIFRLIDTRFAFKIKINKWSLGAIGFIALGFIINSIELNNIQLYLFLGTILIVTIIFSTKKIKQLIHN